MSFQNGFTDVVLCVRESVNITCNDETSRILINDVQFGPSIYNSGAVENSQAIDKEIDIKSRTKGLCNGTNHCYLDNTENSFIAAPTYLPRHVDINYKCEYKYKGCFKDYEDRLLDHDTHLKIKNLTTKICHNLCIGFTHFGTENKDECFCGSNANFHYLKYYQDESKCTDRCPGNNNENCGTHGYISVYQRVDTEARTNWLEATRIHCKYGANVSNINVVAIETYRTCDLYLENNEDINTKCTDGGCRFSYPIPMDGFGGDNFIYIPPYTTVEYSCIPLDIAGESLREDATGSGSITILVIGASVGGLVVFVVIVLMICFVRRRKPKREKNVELTSNHRTSGLNSANTDTEENVYFNSGGDMHEDQTYENGQERPVDDSTDHIYQISAKHRKFQASNDERLNISTNKDHRHSTSSDHYADHVEGVYDIAHKAQYKDNDGEHAIYSHAVEDVYDTAEAHSRPEPRALEGDDLYDKFTSQT